MAAAKRTFLAFGEKKLDSYKKLGETLGKIANRDQFMLAVSWGYRMGTRVEEFKRSGTGVRLEYLKKEDEALLASIQLEVTGDPESLKDVEQRHSIAEQYAEGGILLLGEMMDRPGDFAVTLAGEVRSQLGKLKTAD